MSPRFRTADAGPRADVACNSFVFPFSSLFVSMKYTGPKARRSRRHGMNLYGSDKYDKILQRKPYGPGKGPKVRAGRDSEYAKQLKEKQKARDIYGLSEKQFRRLYKEALKAKGRTGDMIKQLLEQRLDNVIYRAGLSMT